MSTKTTRPMPLRSIDPPDDELARTDLADLSWVRQQCANGAAKGLRAAAGVSIPEVSRVTEAAHSTVWRWENGQRAPHGMIGVRYAQLLRRLKTEVGW